MDVGVKLQTQLVRRGTADTRMEHRATLALFALLVEHDPVKARSHLVQLADHLPDGPLRHIAPKAEMPDHRGVQFGIAPGCVGACLADVDDVAAARRYHLNAGFGISRYDR